MVNRTPLPESVVALFLATSLRHRSRTWRTGRRPAQTPAEYAERAVAAIRKAVDTDAT